MRFLWGTDKPIDYKEVKFIRLLRTLNNLNPEIESEIP
jgi:hypothetical protein